MSRETAQRAVADAVRRQRVKLGLSQREVAEKAGISLRAYASIESGGSYPYDKTLGALARALAWRYDHLLDVRDAALAQSTGEAAAMRARQMVAEIHEILSETHELPEAQREVITKAFREATGDLDATSG